MCKPRIKTVRVKDINLHSDVTVELRKTWASMRYVVEGNSSVSLEALALFLSLHPPVVCSAVGSGLQLSCFAGLRSWQLAKSFLPPFHKIKVVYFEKDEDLPVGDIALIDLYLATVVLGLEFQRGGEQDDLARWACLMTDALIAKLQLRSDPALRSSCELPHLGTYKVVRRIITDIKNAYGVQPLNEQALIMSSLALEVFTLCHPPQLATIGDDDSCYCFANEHTVFSYKKNDSLAPLLNVCLHSGLEEAELRNLVAFNRVFSPIFFGLGGKMWKHDLLRVWHLVGDNFKHKDLLVGLRSKSSLARVFGLNRNTLHSVMQPPKSTLQNLRRDDD